MKLRSVTLSIEYHYDKMSGGFKTSLIDPLDYKDHSAYIGAVDAAADKLVDDFVGLHNVIHKDYMPGVRIPWPPRGNSDVSNARLSELQAQITSRDAWIQENSSKVTAFNQLLDLCGHVEDDSDMIVSLFQDDATKDWIVKTRKSSFADDGQWEARSNLKEAINAMHAKLPKEDDDYAD